MDTLLVTGAAGFIGSHLAQGLADRGVRVVGVDNFDAFYDRAAKEANIARLPAERFSLIEADIRDAARMSEVFDETRPTGVFHIAALAGVRPSIDEPARYAAVNVEGLVNVLEAARRSGCRNVVFASSSSVYGANAKIPFAEDDPAEEPISPYAATKRAGELICSTYSHLYRLSIACLRYFTVFGEAQRPDLAIGKFMRLIAADRPVPVFGDGSSSRDYTYVSDIVAGTLAAFDRIAAERDGFCRTWNLGGSHPTTLSDMIAAIGRVVGKTPRIEQLAMQPGDVERTWADLVRTRGELGWEPRTGFTAGLERQWAWLGK